MPAVQAMSCATHVPEAHRLRAAIDRHLSETRLGHAHSSPLMQVRTWPAGAGPSNINAPMSVWKSSVKAQDTKRELWAEPFTSTEDRKPLGRHQHNLAGSRRRVRMRRAPRTASSAASPPERSSRLPCPADRERAMNSKRPCPPTTAFVEGRDARCPGAVARDLRCGVGLPSRACAATPSAGSWPRRAPLTSRLLCSWCTRARLSS